LDAAAWQQAPRNQSAYKLNEHGPALNVFWSRRSGMGAAVDRKKDQNKDGEAYKEKQRAPDPALEPDG